MEQSKSVDEPAWDSIYVRYHGVMLALARHMLRGDADAEDIVHESFIAAMRTVDNLSASFAVKTWLMRITRNRTLNHLRNTHSRQGILARAKRQDTELTATAESLLIDREARADLQRIFEEIPEVHRQVLLLHLDGLSDADIANVLGIAKGTVYSRLSRARRYLRNR